MRTVIALLAVPSLAAAVSVAQADDTTTLLPTQVTVTIANSPHYSGTFSAQGISRICGKVDLGYPNRANSFTVEFPDDETDLQVRALSFDAESLPAGTTTTHFYVTAGVTTASGAKPAHFVVRADQPQSGATGNATLGVKDGTKTLKVTGTNNMGVRMDVTVICQPRH
jgi:hypothetical protein